MRTRSTRSRWRRIDRHHLCPQMRSNSHEEACGSRCPGRCRSRQRGARPVHGRGPGRPGRIAPGRGDTTPSPPWTTRPTRPSTSCSASTCHNVIAGYFGSGAAGHPNKGYLLNPPYGQGNYVNENFPGSAQTQVTGLERQGRHHRVLGHRQRHQPRLRRVERRVRLLQRPATRPRSRARSTSCSASTTPAPRSGSTTTPRATPTPTS